MYFIGLDVHKKTISYCVKDADGRVFQEGKIGSTRRELDEWIRTMPQPRTIAMEATIFTGWISDRLLPHAEKVKVAHPLMLRAIAAAKKKNDRIDAGKIADCLRCDFLPECHMATTEIRDRRRTLRYRSLVIKQMVQIKNRVSGLRFPHLSNGAATARTEFKILFPAVCGCAKSRLTFANTIGERTNVVRVSTLTESLCSREEIQPLQVLGGAFYVRFSELLAGGGIGYRSPCLCQCSQCADLELASHDRQWQRTSGSNQWQRHFCCHLYSAFRRSSGFCEHR